MERLFMKSFLNWIKTNRYITLFYIILVLFGVLVLLHCHMKFRLNYAIQENISYADFDLGDLHSVNLKPLAFNTFDFEKLEDFFKQRISIKVPNMGRGDFLYDLTQSQKDEMIFAIMRIKFKTNYNLLYDKYKRTNYFKIVIYSNETENYNLYFQPDTPGLIMVEKPSRFSFKSSIFFQKHEIFLLSKTYYSPELYNIMMALCATHYMEFCKTK